MTGEEQHDVVVVGGGVAGVNCALECFDIQLDTVLVEASAALGGQLPDILHSVRNVAAGRFADGRALQQALLESAEILGDRVRLSHHVTKADLEGRAIEVDGGRLSGRALVVATGTRRQFLEAAPDGAFGGDITYQLEPVLDSFAGRDVVAVIGGGDSGTLDALELARRGSSVKLIHRSPELNARQDILRQLRDQPRIEDLPGWQLEAAQGAERLESIVLVRPSTGERQEVSVHGLVVKIARAPNTQLFEGQLELDRSGAVVVDRDLRTSQAGVFAVGDVVAGAYARVAAALGQGSQAARSVLHYLQGRP
ncbi:MAG TPA: NAD(P)/FAD-dependent oxidoreductase [Acidimicrobiia bacterium]|nr:NAD(P)/FAD-dependent oxidoreductase [Acidimicrobiia bacterium]